MVNRVVYTHISMSIESSSALTRLLQLVSPSLPIGAYTYSQGIEWAVEQGWIKTQHDLKDWLQGLMETNVQYLELPVLLRMLQAWRQGDEVSIQKWNRFLTASRETLELRQEESNRARALTQVLLTLEPAADAVKPLLMQTQNAGFSYACHAWNISDQDAATGLLWGWLENLVLSAVKIIPLGQNAGQQVIFELSAMVPNIIQKSAKLKDEDIGSSSMALSIASSRHETLYSRLFRS